MPRPIAQTRIFVTLTLADAAALVTHGQRDAPAAAQPGLAKIRTALEHATPMGVTPGGPLPPLRAKHVMAKAHLRPPPPDPPPAPSARAVDYVPYRDEADGIYT